MFGKNVESTGGDRHSHSVLQEGMSVSGTVEAKGDIRLDGKLEGRLAVSDRVTIGATGVVMADIEAGEVTVMGSVEGSIKVRRRLELRKGARVVGDVSAPTLIIEEGAHFHGNCSMKEDAETAPILGTLPGGTDESGTRKTYDQVYS